MLISGVVRRFDDLGRIVIPKEIRAKLFGTKGNMPLSENEPMEIFLNGEDIILRRYKGEELCEWKKNLLYPGKINNPHVDESMNIATTKYCPCCGKEIKIVD
jgi:AbrB family looped-hinge helix DNA binding protein